MKETVQGNKHFEKRKMFCVDEEAANETMAI